ncbi:unnamed protein product, partial [Coccothraustes coccothraustes]
QVLAAQKPAPLPCTKDSIPQNGHLLSWNEHAVKPLLLSHTTTLTSSQSSPFLPCPMQLPEQREQTSPASQAPCPDPAVAIPLPQ